jgi:hypothetical protein
MDLILAVVFSLVIVEWIAEANKNKKLIFIVKPPTSKLNFFQKK